MIDSRFEMESRLAREVRLSFSRSSGSGGQNVNKVNSRVTLHWNPQKSQLLTTQQGLRLRELYSNRFSADGELVISCEEFRDQIRNIKTCLRKLLFMIEKAYHVPKKRVVTKTTKKSKLRRLNEKKRRSETKELRKVGRHSQ